MIFHGHPSPRPLPAGRFLSRSRPRRLATAAFAAFAIWSGALLGHNLDQRDTLLAFDDATLQMMAGRAGLGQPLLQGGDEIGIILKSTPYPGTATGAGGFLTFYVPVGTQVVKAEYLALTAEGTLAAVPIKGEAINPIGSGPNGQKITTELIGLSLGPNVLGVTEDPVTAAGAHRGTIAGVYADTGIFYSTDPRTTFRSWEAAGGYDGNPLTNDNTVTNNSGDVVIPITRWDAEQLIAFGMKSPGIAVVDAGDQRGNAPWGLASGVAGPQSGYAWEFRRSIWQDTATYPNAADRMKAAVNNMGPWQRIRYPGSQIAFDQAGLISSTNGYAARDASTLGVEVSSGSPLPPTLSTTDSTSPKAIRISFGELELGRSEYGRVTLKILGNPGDPVSPFDAEGKFKMFTDAFGGDAGGEQGGKDHLWRYYYPTIATIDTGAALTKDSSKDILAPGENFQYTIRAINSSSIPLTNVVVTDPLPAGVSFLSASPAPNLTAPLTWNLGTLAANSVVTIVINAKATGSGTIFNTASMTSQQGTVTAADSIFVGTKSLLNPAKTVTPSSVSPGGTVTYTLEMANAGSGPNGAPLVITELLPAGFSYTGMVSQQINGGLLAPASLAVNATNPNRPVFSIAQGINPGSKLVLKFTCAVSSTQPTGSYDNKISYAFEGKTLASGPMATVTVGGARVGDTVYRDWDGDGLQDPEEEGISGVGVELFAADGITLVSSTTTSGTGAYSFAGLSSGSYVVKIGAGIPGGYVLTADPVGAADGQAAVTLSADETRNDIDFGYQPAGAASIGDTVFSDPNKNGVFDGGDAGISGVAVSLYEDTNGNGAVDAGQDALVASATTDGSGIYHFTNLAAGTNYVVRLDPADPALPAFFNPNAFAATTATTIAVPNLAGAVTSADFGFFGLLPASVGDQVYIDSNGNGVFDVGEAPLANMTVNLYSGATLVASETTGPAGTYLFDGLPPGAYQVVVDSSSGSVPSGHVAGTPSIAIALAPGDAVLTADFPFVTLISKSVNKAYAPSGDTVAFTLRPKYSGTGLLNNLRVIDPLPTGTTYVGGSANAGGTYGAYTPVAAVPGNDPGGGGEPVLDTSFTVNSSFVTVGATVTVTMNVKSSAARTDVSPGELEVSGGSYTVLTGPAPASANVPAGGAGTNFVWTVRLDSIGEFIFSADAEDAGETTTWPAASSASTLAASDGGPNVVTWPLGSNAAGIGGETVVSGYTSGLYAFRGATTNAFQKYGIATGAWSSKANASATIAAGGALATNGTGTLFALRGSGTQTFYAYNINTDSWSALANTGTNVNDGGALVYLNAGGTPYVFATIGGTNQLRRYNIGTNSWTAMTNAPNNIRQGGAVTTDGTNIYVLRGDNQKTFWRYNVAANTWTAMAQIPGKVKAGAGLVRIGDYLYATRGGAANSFYRYTISTNTWAALVQTPDFVNAGGCLTTDGTYIYALQGGTAVCWRYNPAANSWTTLAGFGSVVGAGGALVYAPGVTPVGRFSDLRATPSLASGGDIVRVELTLESDAAVANITPSELTVSSTGGASATLVSGPTPASQDVAANGSVTYAWQYSVTAGATPGSVTFAGNATGAGPTVFPSATSNSVLVTPALTFQATVNAPAPAGGKITNTAIMGDDGQSIGSFPSNTTQTSTSGSIGDLVWADADGNGAYDTGENGLAGVEVTVYAADGVTVVATATTDATGLYRVYDLAAGNYIVKTTPGTHPSGYVASTASAVSVTLASGEQYDAADFGLQPPGSGSIGDRVWIDANGDGLQDPDEAGIEGISVALEKWVAGSWLPAGSNTTGADGGYGFAGLAAGTYRVSVDPAGTVASPYNPGFTGTLGGTMTATHDLDGTATVHAAEVVLATNSTVVTAADFGYNWLGKIGDFLWYDTDGNGIADETNFNGGPRPVPNATVVLIVDVNSNGHYDDGDEIIRAFVTADGSAEYPLQGSQTAGGYLFENLPPGNYLVKISEQEVPSPVSGDIGTMMPTTGEKIAASLADGSMEELDADFGFIEAALLEGKVYHDVNHNGIADPGEPGLPNVTVTLTGFAANNDPVSLQTVTDVDGEYTFLPTSGIYTVAYQTADPDIPTSLSIPTTPLTILVAPMAGEEIAGLDFGRDDSGVIGDLVWADVDGDGSKDAGEPGLAGMTVVLYAADGTTFLASTNTDAAGAYSFAGLGDGSYVVEVLTAALPDGYDTTPSGDPDGVKDSRGSASITGGNSVLTLDFGYEPTVTLRSVSGTVFHDLDSNAAPGIPAEALPGVTVSAAVDTNGDTIADQTFTTATDSNGYFEFTAIPDGSNVVITVASGTLPNQAYVQTVDPDGALNHATSISGISGDVTDRNFGYQEQLGSITGSVVEGDGNGSADPGEPALAGASIDLTYAGTDGILGTGDDQSWNTATGSNGGYSFTSLLPGLYRIEQTNLPGYVSVADADGFNPDVINLALSAGQNAVDRDFEDAATRITGHLYFDSNGNGTQDPGEPDLAAISVVITQSDAGSQTVVTDNDGDWSAIVPAGSTTADVDETDPDFTAAVPMGYSQTEGNDPTVVMAVGGQTVDAGIDGYFAPASIGNLVWHDDNNNGLRDGGETGLDGVVVELQDGSGNSIDSDPGAPGVQPTQTVTAGGGSYAFAGIAPGQYRVRIGTPPAGYPMSSATTAETDDQQDDDDNGIQATPSGATVSPVITLTAGESDDTVDFGFTAITGTLSISGQVRDDFDLDGDFSDNDQPSPGVLVRLYADTNGNGIFDAGIDLLLDSTTTNGLGFYTFSNLSDGTYFVEEVDPPGATSMGDTENANDNLIKVVLAGSSSTGNDFLDAVDPAGYAYDVVTGQIIPGGSILVSGPGNVTILLDGSSGQYSFITDGTAGSYTMTYTPPAAYIIDPMRPVAGASFDPTGGPDPTVLGAGEDAMNPGYLTDASAGANPYYLTFDLAAGDPLVINNNIPLRLKTPRKYRYWKRVKPGGGPDPDSNGDGDCYIDAVEYALNLDPSTGVQLAPGFRGVHNTVNGTVDVMFDRVAGGVDDVTYTLTGIASLTASPAGWTNLSVAPSIIDNGDGTETVLFADVESDPFFAGLDHGFVRLKVELDEDEDTVIDVTASTPAFGWTRRQFDAECVMTGHPYLKDKNFCGVVDNVAGNILDVTTAAGGESVVDQFTPGRQFFIEVFSGSAAGHRFEVDEAASTAASIALEGTHLLNTLPAIPPALAGSTVVIREHFTLNDLFPSTQFAATNNAATADRIMLFDQPAGQYRIYWLFANFGTPRWVLSGDATLADRGGLTISPSEGWFTHPKGGAQQLVWHGMVRANPFACPLAAGPNFIGSGYPMDQSPAMRGMTVANGFLGSNNPVNADQVLFWKGYTATQAMAYFNHFLLSYGAFQQWTEIGNASLINENNLLIFKSTTGCIYKMRNGLPGYVMPTPWTP